MVHRQDGGRSPRGALLAVVALAVALRWLFCFWAYPAFLVRAAAWGDTYLVDRYDELADQLDRGHGYRVAAGAPPTLNRPPGYVAVVLLARLAGGAGAAPIQLANGLLGGLATWLTVVATRQRGVRPGPAVAAGAVVALWPFLIWESKVTVPENLAAALVPAILAAHGRWQATAWPGWAAAAGALTAGAALTHGVYQVLIPVVPLAALASVRGRPGRVGAAVMLLAGAGLAAPWAVRNAGIAGRWVGVSTGFGYHYWKGFDAFERLLADPATYFHDNETGMRESVNLRLGRAGFPTADEDAVRSDPAINRFLDESARAHLLAHPVLTVAKTVVKAPLMWVQQRSPARSAATAVLLAPLVALALAGVRRWRRTVDLAPAALVAAVNLSAAAVFVEAIPMRYALPLVPVLAYFAARGAEAWHRRRGPGLTD